LFIIVDITCIVSYFEKLHTLKKLHTATYENKTSIKNIIVDIACIITYSEKRPIVIYKNKIPI
jgi:hypothetical protein